MKKFKFTLPVCAFFFLIIGFCSCGSSDDASIVAIHKFINDTILSLKEVKAKNQLIDSITNHKQSITLLIEEPNDEEPAFYIQAGYNGEEKFETYYHFYLDTATDVIMIRDFALGKRVLLSDWLNQDLDSVYLNLGMELLNSENIEGLEIGMEEYRIVNLLGNPDKTSIPTRLAADSLMHQTWTYKAKAIELDLCWNKGDPKKIFSITVSRPSSFKTSRKIGIGSTKKQVRGSYIIEIDPRGDNERTIVAGSIFSGLVFEFENNIVKEIFIGASAE